MSDAERARFAGAVAEAERAPKDTLLVVVGPTASGKSELAMQMCEALGGEIVSADSVQIYRGFDIGSGKPTSEERARVKHRLIDALDPLEAVDAARYATMAEDELRAVIASGKRPVVCGGTFLWTRALLFGLADAAPADEAVRARHRAEANEAGPAALHQKLREVDPTLAARLHPNDVVRVSRGLEVYELTGRPLSAWQAEHGFSTPRHTAHLFAVERSPEELTARIDARVRGWLANGWIEETRDLLAKGYGAARAMGSVGYKEVAAHLAGELSRDELPTAIVRATRVFARRQRTWLRGLPATPPLTWV